MPIFSNILAPLIAGAFFLLYFIYFAIANPSKAASYRFFVVILLSLSAFSLGRPLQLLLGPHPIPLIVVNLRVFLLCSVISPVIILASDLFDGKRRPWSVAAIVSVCVLLGLAYVAFNTLGTVSSREIFNAFGIAARDNLTPSLMPPFYGREVTIGVQAVTGLLLLAVSLIKLVKLTLKSPNAGLFGNKVFLFNSGVLIFAASFIVGSLAKQWGIYYSASILSALLFGGSVLIDVREVHAYYDRLVPFIKEDILADVALGGASGAKIGKMLECMGKEGLNTFAVLKIGQSGGEILKDIELAEDAMETASRRISAAFGEDRCLVLPLSHSKIGVAFRPPGKDSESEKARVLEILEDLQADFRRARPCRLAIGIGRTRSGPEGLGESYREALAAQEFAERLEDSSVVHADDVVLPDSGPNGYPVREKEKIPVSSLKCE